MSALGKLVLEGDFDTNGQVVVQTPVERVIERSVVVTRTVTETPVAKASEKPAPKAEAPKNEIPNTESQDHARHNSQPPLPYPLAPRPKPSDLTLGRSRDALLTPF